jgi:hypothetical protein
MGVDNDICVVFGVIYSYDELANFREHIDTQNLANEIGTNNLANTWCESGHFYARPYYDAGEKYCEYLLGYEINGDITPDEMTKMLEKHESLKNMIQQFSKHFNIQDKSHDIKFIFRPHVW